MGKSGLTQRSKYHRVRRDTLAFQVDLWSARGEFPRDMLEVITREKEIRYSSRTRAGTDQFKHVQKVRRAVAGLLEKLPEDLGNSPAAKLLSTAADRKVYKIAHLIYRAKDYERHREVLERPKNLEGVFTFDLAEDGCG